MNYVLIKELDSIVTAEINKIILNKEVIVYNKNDVLYREDELSSSAYLLLEGEIKLMKKNFFGKQVLIDRIGPNEMIGVMSLLFTDWIRPATAVVFTDFAKMVKVTKEDFKTEYLKASPEIQFILATISGRLLKSYKRIAHLG